MRQKSDKKVNRYRSKLLSNLLVYLLFLIGMLIMLYPFYISALNNYLDEVRVAIYKKETQDHFNDQQKKLNVENERLKKEGLTPAADPFNEAKADGISEKYYKTHLLGRISLPKINIDMPLFDTTNNDLLEIGATVLNGTSFPLGGESTHSVISAHRGLPNRALFTDLPKLKKGDTFILNVLGKTLAYQVNKIQVVTPDQTNVLKIEPGKDLVTLITCTPYMINSHRLLVTGVRVPYTEQIKKELAQSSHHQLIIRLIMIIGFLLFCLVMIWLLYRVIHGYLLSKQSITLAIRILDEKDQPYMGGLTLHEKNGKKPLVRKQIPVVLIPDKTGRYQIDNLPKRVYCLKSDDGRLRLIIGQHKLKQPMVVVQKTRRTRLPSKWHVEVTQKNRHAS